MLVKVLQFISKYKRPNQKNHNQQSPMFVLHSSFIECNEIERQCSVSLVSEVIQWTYSMLYLLLRWALKPPCGLF